MSKRDVIVVGASAGGLDMLRQLLAQLPADFPASIFVVWHLSRDYPSQLAQILSRASALPVTQAIDGEAINVGHVYVARPDHHLLVAPGRIQVRRGPMENRFRPSIDVLFRSAALTYGPRVISVILSGALDDGAAGSYAVKERGGLTIVQDPVDADYYDMPIHTMKAVEVDYVLPVADMGQVLSQLVTQQVEEETEHPVSSQMEIEVSIAREDNSFENGVMQLGEASVYTCPECHGTLLQIKEGNRIRFRCHTGHAYSLDTLLADVTKTIDESLWASVRAIEESLMLLKHMGQHLQESSAPDAAQHFFAKAEKARLQAQRVREVLMENEILSQEKVERPSAGEPPSIG